MHYMQGIVGDTGRFFIQQITITFAMVSKLLEFDVDISGIAYHGLQTLFQLAV